MLDVIVAGAGPAGAIAALVLARAGARVLIVDRDRFPREKLCGDTLNPGAVRLLAALGLAGGPLLSALPIRGMRVTGPSASVSALYGGDVHGLALTRRALDAWLLDAAIQAGARFEPECVVRRPLLDDQQPEPHVRGLVVTARQARTETRLPALLVIAADGRRSVLAGQLGLRRDPPAIRRWAFGTYADGVTGMADLGEMHVRHGWYLGLAPMPGGRTNVCVVTPPRPAGRNPIEIISTLAAGDAELRERLRHAQFDTAARVLGPLAADVHGVGRLGLLLAGDAAGFVDPMTGDGLRLAMAGGQLAAAEALRGLETGDFAGALGRLADARQRAFGRKLFFNRWMRRLVSMPLAVDVASTGARLWPGAIRAAVRFAGDVS